MTSSHLCRPKSDISAMASRGRWCDTSRFFSDQQARIRARGEGKGLIEAACLNPASRWHGAYRLEAQSCAHLSHGPSIDLPKLEAAE